MILFCWISIFAFCLLGIGIERVNFTFAGNKIGGKRNNTVLHIIEFACLGLSFIVISSNIIGVDIINYNNWYIRSEVIEGRELLYTFLRNTFKNITGASFYMFRAFMTALFGIFPVLFFRKYRVNICFFLLIYNISLIFFDSMQFRNSIALFGLIYLSGILVENKKTFWSKVVFIVGILLISQIHTAFLSYLIFLPMLSRRKLTYGKIIFVCSIGLLLLTILNGNRVPFLDVLYSWFLSESDNRTYVNAGGHFIFILPATIHAFTTLLLAYYSKQVIWNKDHLSQFREKYTKFILANDLCFFCVVPLIIMNTTFYRIIRNLFPMNIIAIYFIYSNTKAKKQRLYMILGLIAISISWLIFKIGFYSSAEIIIGPVLKYGDLFFLH